VLPGLSREGQAVLSALVAATGAPPAADAVARQVGLANRYRLARRLDRDGLPPFGELADWISILQLLWQSEATGDPLLPIALERGLEPATCYRRCRRTLGVPWRAARRRGFAWGMGRFLARCARGRRAALRPAGLTLAVARSLESARPPAVPRPPARPGRPGRAAGRPRGVVAYHLPLGDAPTDVAVSPGGVIYATRAFAAQVDRIDLRARRSVVSIDVGANPTRLAFDPTGRVAYVTNQFDDSVSVVDVSRNLQVDDLPVAGDPAPVVASADGRHLFVCTNDDELVCLNVLSRRVRARLALPATSHHLTEHPRAGVLYVSTRAAGTVMEVETPSLRVRRTFHLGGRTQALVVAPDGTELYVADELGAVHVVALEAGVPAATVHLPAGAYGLALTPDGEQLFVTMPGAGCVQVLDRVSRRHVQTVITGGAPRHTAFTADGRTGLIVNERGWITVVW